MIVANDQVTDSQLEKAMSTYELFTDTILQTAILIESKKPEVLNITIYYTYVIVYYTVWGRKYIEHNLWKTLVQTCWQCSWDTTDTTNVGCMSCDNHMIFMIYMFCFSGDVMLKKLKRHILIM